MQKYIMYSVRGVVLLPTLERSVEKKPLMRHYSCICIGAIHLCSLISMLPIYLMSSSEICSIA